MDDRLLPVIQRELADGYGVYHLTATEALLVRLPSATHRSTMGALFGPGGLLQVIETSRADRYGRVWIDDAGRVNVEHGTERYDPRDP